MTAWLADRLPCCSNASWQRERLNASVGMLAIAQRAVGHTPQNTICFAVVFAINTCTNSRNVILCAPQRQPNEPKSKNISIFPFSSTEGIMPQRVCWMLHVCIYALAIVVIAADKFYCISHCFCAPCGTIANTYKSAPAHDSGLLDAGATPAGCCWFIIHVFTVTARCCDARLARRLWTCVHVCVCVYVRRVGWVSSALDHVHRVSRHANVCRLGTVWLGELCCRFICNTTAIKACPTTHAALVSCSCFVAVAVSTILCAIRHGYR